MSLRQVNEKYSKIKQLSKSWYSFVDDVSGPSNQTQYIIHDNMPHGESDLHSKVNSSLIEVDNDLEQFVNINDKGTLLDPLNWTMT